MKKIYLIVFCLVAFASVKAQYVTISDTVFRNFLMSKYPSCFNAGKQMDTACSTIVNASSLDLSNLNIINYYGIQFFKNLVIFDCSNNPYSSSTQASLFPAILMPNTLKSFNSENTAISDFPKLPNTLTHLNMSGNYLTTLPLTSFPSSLIYLNFSNNILAYNVVIPSFPNSLKSLLCASINDNDYSSVRTAFPTLPNSLEYLDCGGYWLKRPLITILPNTLRWLNPGDAVNNLPLPDSLRTLNISSNYYTLLDTIKSLNLDTVYASAYSLGLTKLPILPNTVRYLNIQRFGDTLPKLPNNLKYLDCSYGNIKVWNNIPNTLETLIVRGRWSYSYSPNITGLQSILPYLIHLKYLDLNMCNSYKNVYTPFLGLPDSLEYFDCRNNNITFLPTLPSQLKHLACGSEPGVYGANGSSISVLPQLPNKLEYLDCVSGLLGALPALPNTLKYLNVFDNNIHQLPTLSNTSLTYLNCRDNYYLTKIPALPNTLEFLDCHNNHINNIANFPKKIRYIDCSVNDLSDLPQLGDSLQVLRSWGNDRIACFPKLPKTLKEFWISSLYNNCLPNKINCLVTEVKSDVNGGINWFHIMNPQPPVCNPTNNSNNCIAMPLMQGDVFYDINSNGIKDTNEYFSENIRIELSNGYYTFTNNNGHYEITSDSIGDYGLKIVAPNYYNAVSDSFSYHFTTYNSFATETIALQPLQNKDSVTVKITPWQNCARPVSSLDYIINYENVGTTNLSPVVTFNYDSALLSYVKSSNNFVVNNGATLTLNISSFAVGQTGGFTASFIVKSTDTLGSITNANVAIAGGSCTAVDTVHSTVKSSFDPNDKNATPVLTPLQVALGKDIDYTIRFQNTGTDTAFNVVITDTLDNQLQHNTMQLVGSSHNCKATVKDGVAVFEFLKINLPDSNTNKLKSHGFVNFKIKPNSSLTNGAIVPNNAAIYFDYNTPVNTNTALTQINASGIVTPVRFTMYVVKLINEKQVINNWQTNNEVNVSHYNIQRSIDGKTFATIGQVKAKGGGEYNFADPLTTAYLPLTIYYRLQAMDKDGQTSYSEIKQIRIRQINNQLVTVYPNPTKDNLTIECKGIKQIKVVNILGQTIQQLNNLTTPQTPNAKQTITINTKQWNKGMYIVSFDNGEKVKVVRE